MITGINVVLSYLSMSVSGIMDRVGFSVTDMVIRKIYSSTKKQFIYVNELYDKGHITIATFYGALRFFARTSMIYIPCGGKLCTECLLVNLGNSDLWLDCTLEEFIDTTASNLGGQFCGTDDAGMVLYYCCKCCDDEKNRSPIPDLSIV